MPTYAIGDVQGCYQALLSLLDSINFDAGNDRLWFAGDIVNRGPQSLETLHFVRELGETAVTVLGNHDLHTLAVAAGSRTMGKTDTIACLTCPAEREATVEWLRWLPLIHHDKEENFSLVHAGLPPQWEMQQALAYQEEVTEVLRGSQYRLLLDTMYGNQPDYWQENLSAEARLRFIINCLTRIRYCDKDGKLDFATKRAPGTQASSLQPWFTMPDRLSKHHKIVFGHWATVHLGEINNFSDYNVFPVDTGCCWGGALTALRLEDETWFKVPCQGFLDEPG